MFAVALVILFFLGLGTALVADVLAMVPMVVAIMAVSVAVAVARAAWPPLLDGVLAVLAFYAGVISVLVLLFLPDRVVRALRLSFWTD